MGGILLRSKGMGDIRQTIPLSKLKRMPSGNHGTYYWH